MTPYRALTTPEEVLAALRAGERVEFSYGAGAQWEPSGLHGDTQASTVKWNLTSGFHYRAPCVAPPRPRTFTAAEVAEAFAGLEAKWRAESDQLDSGLHQSDDDRENGIHAQRLTTCADELHERITHWLRENEG